MKIAALIERLQALQKIHGDLDVRISCKKFSRAEEQADPSLVAQSFMVSAPTTVIVTYRFKLDEAVIPGNGTKQLHIKDWASLLDLPTEHA